MTREEIFTKLEANKETIKGFGVSSIGVFGSFAREDESDSSDIDFLVELEEETLNAYMGLKFFLEELFGREVDLVMKETIKPRIREPILQEVIYAQGF